MLPHVRRGFQSQQWSSGRHVRRGASIQSVRQMIKLYLTHALYLNLFGFVFTLVFSGGSDFLCEGTSAEPRFTFSR